MKTRVYQILADYVQCKPVPGVPCGGPCYEQAQKLVNMTMEHYFATGKCQLSRDLFMQKYPILSDKSTEVKFIFYDYLLVKNKKQNSIVGELPIKVIVTPSFRSMIDVNVIFSGNPVDKKRALYHLPQFINMQLHKLFYESLLLPYSDVIGRRIPDEEEE